MVRNFHEMIVFILHINIIINNIVLKATKGSPQVGGHQSPRGTSIPNVDIFIAGKWKNKPIVEPNSQSASEECTQIN